MFITIFHSITVNRDWRFQTSEGMQKQHKITINNIHELQSKPSEVISISINKEFLNFFKKWLTSVFRNISTNSFKRF